LYEAKGRYQVAFGEYLKEELARLVKK
jgi:hypothetical protein